MVEHSVDKRKLQDLLSVLSPNHELDPLVEDALLEIADEFVESATSFACSLAKHRHSDILEVKDLALHLERNWGIRIPGYSVTTMDGNIAHLAGGRPTDVHRHRLALKEGAEIAREGKSSQ